LRDLPPSAVEATDDQNQTPLHLAAFYGMPQIAKLLIKKKASLTAKVLFIGFCGEIKREGVVDNLV